MGPQAVPGSQTIAIIQTEEHTTRQNCEENGAANLWVRLEFRHHRAKVITFVYQVPIFLIEVQNVLGFETAGHRIALISCGSFGEVPQGDIWGDNTR